MQRIENITNSIHISWIPSFNCNFSCRYCAPEFYQKTAPIASLKQLKIIYYKLQPFIDNKKNIVFWFTGGEPSKVPDLLDFCKFLKSENKSFKIGITTNGSSSFNYYYELLKYVHEIAFSVHFDFIKYKAYFKKLIKLVPKYRNRVHFCIMCDPKYMDQVIHSVNLLEKFNIKFNLLRIAGTPLDDIERNFDIPSQYEDFILKYSSNDSFKTLLVDGVPYSDHEFKNLLNNDYTKFKGWVCHVPSEHLFIRYDTLYGGECKRVRYGNLLTDKILPKDYIICDGRRCTCTGDLRTTKYELNKSK